VLAEGVRVGGRIVLAAVIPPVMLALGGYVCFADAFGWWPWHRRR
jgi:hypothetical protein